MKSTRRNAFTIVELLVVVSIIGILLALASAGLRAAISSGKQSKEMNRVRQITVAWLMYSGQYEDRLLPGILEQALGQPGMQTDPADPSTQAWRVHYKDQRGNELEPSLCQTYPWRLASYLDYDSDPFLGYRSDGETNLALSVYRDPEYPVDLPSSMASAIALDGAGVAFQPGFGYNAYYLGGWWKLVAGVPTLAFGHDGYTQPGSASIIRNGIVATRLSGISRPSELVAFCASTYLPASSAPYSKFSEYDPGSAWVVPHRLGTADIWGFGGVTLETVSNWEPDLNGRVMALLNPMPTPLPQGDIGSLLVHSTQSVPFERYGKSVSLSHADGSTTSEDIAVLNDVRYWVPCAEHVTFTHSP